MIPEEEEFPYCPDHPSEDLVIGYGLAGGGLGAYMYCPLCYRVCSKVQDPEAYKE